VPSNEQIISERISMPFVSISNVSKRFGATAALTDVGFTLKSGKIHGLLGENGAGKSTLMKVLAGVVRPDAGEVTIEGNALHLGSPEASRGAGLAMAFQELSSPPNVTVGTKLALPDLPRGPVGLVSARKIRDEAIAKLTEWDIEHITPDAVISDLNLADRQHIELVNALARRPKLLILDEPTAALPDPEWLFQQLRKITQAGTAVIYISHKFPEIEELCDTGTVLRNGRVVGSFEKGSMNERELIQMMIGRSLNQAFPARPKTLATSETGLRIRGLTVPPKLNGVDLDVRPGEVVGIAGLEGQGQYELFYSLAGLLPSSGGDVTLLGDKPGAGRGKDAGREDFVLVPEERKTEALFMQMPSLFNFTVSHLKNFRGWSGVSQSKEKQFALAAASEVNLPESLLGKSVAALSGGNQQKIVFGRAILRQPKCLLLFDPTRGVDAATKMEIYHMTRKYAEDGGSVLLYSTEIPELVGLCDRVYSIYGGKVQKVHEDGELTDEAIMAAALGHAGRGAVA
jgi:ribose transport system ATP-binding protein